MTAKELSIELYKNQQIITALLTDVHSDFINYQYDENTWSPLIVICHLVDEEKDDFRARIQHIIAYPDAPPPPIDPEGWVKTRDYASQNFLSKLAEWNTERRASLEYLETIDIDDYQKGFDHIHFGRFTVSSMMDNWLAHDLLHIRQLTRIRYRYLLHRSKHGIEYAGIW